MKEKPIFNGTFLNLDQRWWYLQEWNLKGVPVILSKKDFKERIHLMNTLGINDIILTNSILFGQSLYPSSLLPCMYDDPEYDPIDIIMNEASILNMNVYMPIGSMVEKEEDINTIPVNKTLFSKEVANELHKRYGDYSSFAGWYIPEEPQAGIVEWLPYTKHIYNVCHNLTPEKPVIQSIHIMNEGIDNIELLKQLKVDILCVQIFAERCSPTTASIKLGEAWNNRLNRVDRVAKACRQADINFWISYEIYDYAKLDPTLSPPDNPGSLTWQLQTLLPALEPCKPERLQWQLPMLTGAADKIVCRQIAGAMEDEYFSNPYGGAKAYRLLNEYLVYLNS